jgi:hypothetical protein
MGSSSSKPIPKLITEPQATCAPPTNPEGSARYGHPESCNTTNPVAPPTNKTSIATVVATTVTSTNKYGYYDASYNWISKREHPQN